jgi:L-threonylcarbamoyladenylate synthase
MSYSANTRIFQLNSESPETAFIQIGADALRLGGLVAFPTETVYGLGANALDSEAVGRIFSAKGRPASDPVIVHLYEIAQLDVVAVDVPELAYRLADQFWPGPLTLVLHRNKRIPPNISAGLDTVAVRMPNHPIPLALFRAADLPVAAPSANRFARPSATTAQHVLEDLNGHVDVILDGGEAIIGLESSILNLTSDPPKLLRPGAIPVEALQAIVPDIQVVSKHLKAEEGGIEAPGMLSKHYSPRAELVLFSGSPEGVIEAMKARTGALIKAGKRVGILTAGDEDRYFQGAQVFRLGTDLGEIGHNLFSGMRELDRGGVDVILVHGFEPTGLGAALWDRLLRAAEGRVVQC